MAVEDIFLAISGDFKVWATALNANRVKRLPGITERSKTGVDKGFSRVPVKAFS
jgi:hypothetical protein